MNQIKWRCGSKLYYHDYDQALNALASGEYRREFEKAVYSFKLACDVSNYVVMKDLHVESLEITEERRLTVVEIRFVAMVV